MVAVKTYPDGTVLSKDKGRIDDWCIYVNNVAPLDSTYLKSLVVLAEKYGVERVYKDFNTIYVKTTNDIENVILNVLIPEIAETYEEDSLEIDKLFSTLYLVMLAEQNRMLGTTRTKLGKRIKGIAVYQILFEGFSVEEACNYCIGRGWREIKQLCEERNIVR